MGCTTSRRTWQDLKEETARKVCSSEKYSTVKVWFRIFVSVWSEKYFHFECLYSERVEKKRGKEQIEVTKIRMGLYPCHSEAGFLG